MPIKTLKISKASVLTTKSEETPTGIVYNESADTNSMELPCCLDNSVTSGPPSSPSLADVSAAPKTNDVESENNDAESENKDALQLDRKTRATLHHATANFLRPLGANTVSPSVVTAADASDTVVMAGDVKHTTSTPSDSSSYVPTPEEEHLLKQLKQLKEKHAAELKEAKAKARREAFAAKIPTLKISNKGCVQVNGIRRFPITLYKNEWEKIFEIIPDIQKFIEVNNNDLASI